MHRFSYGNATTHPGGLPSLPTCCLRTVRLICSGTVMDDSKSDIKCVVTLVHGTFAPTAAWCEPDIEPMRRAE